MKEKVYLFCKPVKRASVTGYLVFDENENLVFQSGIHNMLPYKNFKGYVYALDDLRQYFGTSKCVSFEVYHSVPDIDTALDSPDEKDPIVAEIKLIQSLLAEDQKKVDFIYVEKFPEIVDEIISVIFEAVVDSSNCVLRILDGGDGSCL